MRILKWENLNHQITEQRIRPAHHFHKVYSLSRRQPDKDIAHSRNEFTETIQDVLNDASQNISSPLKK